jgi:hypothetical protein
MYGDWALSGHEYSYIALFDLAKKHMPRKQVETIRFSDICAKPGDWFGGDGFLARDMKRRTRNIRGS